MFQALIFLALCLITLCHTKPSYDKRSPQCGFGDFGFGFNFDDDDYDVSPLWGINMESNGDIGLQVNTNLSDIWDKIKGRFKNFKESVKEFLGRRKRSADLFGEFWSAQQCGLCESTPRVCKTLGLCQ